MSVDGDELRENEISDHNGVARVVDAVKRIRAQVTDRHNQPLPLRDAMMMNPIEKMTRHARPPCKLLLNLTLIGLLWACIAMDIPLARDDVDVMRQFVGQFMPDNFLSPADHFVDEPTTFLATADNVRAAVRRAVGRYFALASSAIGDRDLPVASEEKENAARGVKQNDTAFNMSWVEPPKLTLTMAQRSPRWFLETGGTREATFDLTMDNPLGPLAWKMGKPSGDCALRLDPVFGGYYLPCRSESLADDAVFDNLLEASLAFRIFGDMGQRTTARGLSVFEWSVVLHWDLRATGLCKMWIEVSWKLSRLQEPWWYRAMYIAVMVCAVWDVGLRIRACLVVLSFRRAVRSARTMADLENSAAKEGAVDARTASLLPYVNGARWRRREVSRQRQMSDTHWFESQWKATLLQDVSFWWHLWSITTDLLALVFVVIAYARAMELPLSSLLQECERISLGLSSLGASTLLLSYLRYFRGVYFMIHTMRCAIPELVWFLWGVAPLFGGYVVFGVVVLGATAAPFAGWRRAAMSLTCAMYGDSLLPLFDACGGTRSGMLKAMGVAYNATFVGMFMMIVLNVAIAIVVDTYAVVSVRFGIFSSHTRAKHAILGQRSGTVIATQAMFDALDSVELAWRSVRRREREEEEDDPVRRREDEEEDDHVVNNVVGEARRTPPDTSLGGEEDSTARNVPIPPSRHGRLRGETEDGGERSRPARQVALERRGLLNGDDSDSD